MILEMLIAGLQPSISSRDRLNREVRYRNEEANKKKSISRKELFLLEERNQALEQTKNKGFNLICQGDGWVNNGTANIIKFG